MQLGTSTAAPSNMGRSTFGAIVMQLCDAMEKVILHCVIKLGDAQEVIDGFAHEVL